MVKNNTKYLPHTWVDPRLYVGISSINGQGIFASSDIREGEKVMVWGGVVIKRNEYENTWEKYRPQTVVQINEEEYLGLPVGEEEVSMDEYLNHSCDPNLWLIDEVTLVARRNIASGEELTLDSATWNDDTDEEYSDDSVCTCGSEVCRIKLTPHDWKIPVLQKKYAGHFSPYLEKRIRRPGRRPGLQPVPALSISRPRQ